MYFVIPLSDHITSPSAVLMPLRELCDLCRAHGILVLVDGAHCCGQLPIQLEYLGADFYTGTMLLSFVHRFLRRWSWPWYQVIAYVLCVWRWLLIRPVLAPKYTSRMLGTCVQLAMRKWFEALDALDLRMSRCFLHSPRQACAFSKVEAVWSPAKARGFREGAIVPIGIVTSRLWLPIRDLCDRCS